MNTLGIPRYKEVNPGLLTLMTFPFLFGVMFGDIGHGLILFSFGLYLILMKKDLAKEGGSFKDLLSVRYLFTFMGFFAFYCGLIYNDFISFSINIFGSCFEESGGKLRDCSLVIPKY